MLAARSQSQEAYILDQPRPALRGADKAAGGMGLGPSTQHRGQSRLARRLTGVLDGLGRMEVWLQSVGRAGLTPCDRLVLTPSFSRLARDSHNVATLAGRLNRGAPNP